MFYSKAKQAYREKLKKEADVARRKQLDNDLVYLLTHTEEKAHVSFFKMLYCDESNFKQRINQIARDAAFSAIDRYKADLKKKK